ncbi:MAG TPA: hypothetical protein VD997_02510 [Phycisphaerales bacterium]|nr:hypothetical protein [Phycisphaerales bacterium]
MRICSAVLATALVMVPCVVGVAPHGRQESTQRAGTSKPEVAFYIYQKAGHGPGHSGLLLAAWDDGLIIFPEDQKQPDRKQRAARVDGAKVRALVAELETIGFFDPGVPQNRGLAPDAGSMTIGAVKGGVMTEYTRGDMAKDTFESIDTADSTRKFERVWAGAFATLRHSLPADSKPLSEDKEAQAQYGRARGGNKLPILVR